MSGPGWAPVIARRLTRGQRSCILNMDAEPALLGCSEPWAMRMMIGNYRRPALTYSVRDDQHRLLFGLTEDGVSVKQALIAMERADG